jgi:hypothetical protein
MGVYAYLGPTILLLFTLGTAAAEAKRVLMLHSFDPIHTWGEYARIIRTELEPQSPWPLDH